MCPIHALGVAIALFAAPSGCFHIFDVLEVGARTDFLIANTAGVVYSILHHATSRISLLRLAIGAAADVALAFGKLRRLTAVHCNCGQQEH
jgi:hypothetical protein